MFVVYKNYVVIQVKKTFGKGERMRQEQAERKCKNDKYNSNQLLLFLEHNL